MESARLQLDALAGQISTDLLRLNPDDLDAELERSLRQIGEALDAEQATLLSFGDHDELFDVVGSWGRRGGTARDAADGPLTMQIVGLLHGDQVRIVRIPDDLAAGNYTMKVLAYDRLEPSKKKQLAEQWVDVTVVRP
jgi:hypothetical protein